MPTNPKPKTLDDDKVQQAASACDKALDAFDEAQRDFELAVYEAGHQDLESFLAAVQVALKEHGGQFHLSKRAASFLFDKIKK